VEPPAHDEPKGHDPGNEDGQFPGFAAPDVHRGARCLLQTQASATVLQAGDRTTAGNLDQSTILAIGKARRIRTIPQRLKNPI
jgi:hypothetical protein